MKDGLNCEHCGGMNKLTRRQKRRMKIKAKKIRKWDISRRKLQRWEKKGGNKEMKTTRHPERHLPKGKGNGFKRNI